MSETTVRKPETDNTVCTLPKSISPKKRQATTSEDRIVRPAEAVSITGRSLASIWRDEQAGSFPRKVRIGSNAVGYRLSELQTWLGSRETVTKGNTIAVAPGARRGRKPSTSVGE